VERLAGRAQFVKRISVLRVQSEYFAAEPVVNIVCEDGEPRSSCEMGAGDRLRRAQGECVEKLLA
jgi:hypothetical protein